MRWRLLGLPPDRRRRLDQSHTKKSPSAGGPTRCRPGLGEAAARRARRLCPPLGRAADQGVALRRRFAGGGRSEGDCAVRESRAGAEPLPRRQCRPDANRAGGAAGNRTDIAAARAHAFARRGGSSIVPGRNKLRRGAVKLLKSFARVNLRAGASPIVGSIKSRHFCLDLTEDWLSAPYWVRWPGAAAKMNRLARSCPICVSFASSINKPGVAQASRSAPIWDWKGSIWPMYQLLAGTFR
jgi:hypothetical protein